jgi:hypothetical protein
MIMTNTCVFFCFRLSNRRIEEESQTNFHYLCFGTSDRCLPPPPIPVARNGSFRGRVMVLPLILFLPSFASFTLCRLSFSFFSFLFCYLFASPCVVRVACLRPSPGAQALFPLPCKVPFSEPMQSRTLIFLALPFPLSPPPTHTLLLPPSKGIACPTRVREITGNEARTA